MIELVVTKRTDARLLKLMQRHYSRPAGFVGRSICYAVTYGGKYYGHIVGGSATRFLPGRNEFFGCSILALNEIVNNTFFHIEPFHGGYPTRNFAQKVLKAWRIAVWRDWEEKYGVMLLGYESLVEFPRTGECYLRDGWAPVGATKGYTCKRIGGVGTDSWSGKRVWDTENLRPKLVFVRRLDLQEC